MLGLVMHKWGLGDPKATGKGFGRAWVGSRAAGDRVWGQHEANLSQLGANLGPCWVQIGSSRPSCNHEGMLRPLGAYTTQDAKNDPNIIKICSKTLTKLDAFKTPEKQKHSGKHRSGSKSRKKDHEAKTYRFESHLGAILASSWGAWVAFGGHFGRLGANLSQHKVILSHLGANLRPPEANMTPT